MLIGQDAFFKNVLNFKSAIYVEAPAGTGKTYSCIKAAEILCNNKRIKDYEKILILTFSRNARAQLINELSKHIDNDYLIKHVNITNYHSFYKIYLDKYRDLLGIKKEISIVDDEEYKIIFKLTEKEDIDFGYIYKKDDKYYYYKNNIECFDNKRINNYEKQRKESIESGILTFDMFGILIKDLVEKSPFLVNLISHDYPYVFLDEYQDTDELQEQFLEKFNRSCKFIYFADPMQMIYEFKGASNKRISNIKRKYKDLVEISFIDNYRYRDKADIINMLSDIRNGRIPNYSTLQNGYVFPIKVRGNNLFSEQVKSSLPTWIFYSLINKNDIMSQVENKSICVLVRTNDIVEKLCDKFSENNIICNEISDGKYMLKLNIWLKKYFNDLISKDDMVKYLLKIYCLCKRNKKIDDESLKTIDELTLSTFQRKRKWEYVQLKTILSNYSDLLMNKKEILNKFIENIKLDNRSHFAVSFINNVLLMEDISDKCIDNIYTQRQYYSSFSKINPGIYIANYWQSKGREFDYVIVINDMKYNKDKNIIYVTHSRMREKLFIGNYYLQSY